MKIFNKRKRIKNKIMEFLRSLTKHTDVLVVFFIFTVFLFIGSVIFPVIPLTYDEAWNFTELSSKGLLYSVTHYPVPNNHIFFTAIQSLSIPISLLREYPFMIRLPNIIFGSILLTLIYSLINKIINNKIYSILLTLAVIFSSDLLVQYFIIARGYLLATLLSFFGLYFLWNRKYYVAGIFFVLSIWTIPTFLFLLPLLYAYILTTHKEKHHEIVMSMVLMFVCLIFCYYPVFGSVIENSHGWTDFSFDNYIRESIISISNLGSYSNNFLVALLYLIIYLAFLYLFLKYHIKSNFNYVNLIIYLNVSILSYEIVTIFLWYLNIINFPFIRNGIFIPLYINLSLLIFILLIKKSGISFILLLFFLINSFFGLYNLFTNKIPQFPTKNSLNYLKRNQLKEIVINKEDDLVVGRYFSFIYDKPIKINYPKMQDSEKLLNKKDPINFEKLSNSYFNKIYYYIFKIPYIKPLYLQKIFDRLSIPLMSTEQKSVFYLQSSNYLYSNSIHFLLKYGTNYTYSALLYAENNITLLIPELIKLQMKGVLNKFIIDKYISVIFDNQKYLDGIILLSNSSTKWVNLRHMSEINLRTVESFK